MNVEVETPYGRVRGRTSGSHALFLGLPYAQAPTGALRFEAPRVPQPTAGVRDATSVGPISHQGRSFAPGVGAEGAQSEDCLVLNVFTPSADDQQRPVLVWIHGGAFTVGASTEPLYDGGRLAERGDVVVVSLNYRLGVLGFLNVWDDQSEQFPTRNLWLRDQVAALSWVRECIACFGGDPNNVTIFGESAGASSVCSLMISPLARGLFHRAISQSSALTTHLKSPEEAAEGTTRPLLEALGLARSEIARLRTLPAEDIVAAQRKIERAGLKHYAFYPVRDDETLPEHPLDALSRAQAAHVPLIIGTNRDEWNLFDAPNVSLWDQPMPETEAAAYIARLLGVEPARAAAALYIYRASRAALGLPCDNRSLVRAIEGDYRFRLPSTRFAAAHAAHGGRTHAYLFTYESPGLRGALGACHGLDIPFVFGGLGLPGQDRFAGKGPGPSALSQTMMDAWCSFARGGVPSSLPSWAKYDATKRSTMVLNIDTHPEDGPLEQELAAFDGLD